MKKYLYFSSLVAMVLSLLGCSSAEINDLSNDKVENQASDYTIPLEDAIKKADLFLQELEHKGNTRARDRVVSSVERLGVQTRSDVDEGGCYIVNYGEDEGFAIISTDSRTMPIYAISPEGHFSINDTVGNPVLKELTVLEDNYNTYYHIVWGRNNEINGYYFLDLLNMFFSKSARFKSGNDLARDIPAYYRFNDFVRGF